MKWQPCRRQGWKHAAERRRWILGVFRGGTQLNPVDKNISDLVAGVRHLRRLRGQTRATQARPDFVVHASIRKRQLRLGADANRRTVVGPEAAAPPLQSVRRLQAVGARTLRVCGGRWIAAHHVVCPAKGTWSRWEQTRTPDNSSICTAAVHVGLITLTPPEGRSRSSPPGLLASRLSFTHNGITPLVGGSWPGSFRSPP